MATLIKTRVTRVCCDKCRSNHYITTSSSSQQISESKWDQLLVEQLRLLGWSAGLEPSAHHQRIAPDICPDCNTRKETA